MTPATGEPFNLISSKRDHPYFSHKMCMCDELQDNSLVMPILSCTSLCGSEDEHYVLPSEGPLKYVSPSDDGDHCCAFSQKPVK